MPKKKQSKTSKKTTSKATGHLGVTSINQLMAITGMAYRTIVKKLKQAGIDSVGTQGRAKLYNTPEAVAALFHVKHEGDEERLDPTQEKAKLYNQQWRTAKIQRKKLKRELVSVGRVQYFLESMVTNMKTKMLAIPNGTAKMLSTMRDKNDIVDYLTDEVTEALTDLSSDHSWIDDVVEDE